MTLSSFSFGAGTLYDIAALAVLLFVIISYARKGFVAGVIQFVGNLLSVFGAQWIARTGAAFIFDKLFAGSLSRGLGETLENSTEGLAQAIEKYAGFLPQSVRSTIVQSADEAMAGGTANLVETIVDDVIAPLVTPILAVLVFFVSYAILRAVVALLVQIFVNVNRLPVLGGINGVLGGVLGVGAGALDLFLVLCALWAVMMVTGNSLPFLNDNILSTSMVYNGFSQINPFA